MFEQAIEADKPIQLAIEQAEKIDQRIASINAETQLKSSNKNRITITQVVEDKNRIRFASLAREVIADDNQLELIPINTARSDKDYHFRHPDIPQSVYVQLKPSGAKGAVREDPNELLTGIFSCMSFKNPTIIEELDVLIDSAKENISKSEGHTQGQIDLFDKNYTNACQAQYAANSIKSK